MSAAEDNQKIGYLVGATASPMIEKVWLLAEPVCQGEGMELVQVEYQREPGGRTLRLYVDKPGGISLDDCVAISRQLSDVLDVNLETEASYRLEVSSPGEQRPLGKLSDFDRFKGCRAKVRTTHPIGGQKNFTGVLNGVEQNIIQLMIGERSVQIQLGDIAKAHLI